MEVQGTMLYYVQNAQGDVVAIITEAGEKVVEYRWRFLEQYKYFFKRSITWFSEKIQYYDSEIIYYTTGN